MTRFLCFSAPLSRSPASRPNPAPQETSPSPLNIAALPDGVLTHIAMLLPPDSLKQFEQVNRAWRAVAEPVWREHWQALRRPSTTLPEPPLSDQQISAAYKLLTSTQFDRPTYNTPSDILT